jgi:predicted CXXCH cytochrome family protein
MTRVLGKWVAVALLAAASLWSVQPQAAIKNTKHDLSAGNTTLAVVKATDPAETQTCVFCHVPHNSSSLAPLWNRNNPAATGYTQYTSTTIKGTMGQPNGSSLLCLSCHDGSIALGETLSRTITVTGTNAAAGKLTGGVSFIGRDLSDDHPVSFAYNAALVTASAGELTLPAASSKVKLDSAGRMQCASCHDAHNNDITANGGKFLVMPNTASALCIVCHTKLGWSASSHATSAATWNGTGTNPWLHTPQTQTTVASNACENCHQPHTAQGKQRLLNYAAEEANCFTCHTGNVAGKTAPTKNLQTETTKTYGHKVANYLNIHDPAEAAMPLNARHVECADCHNPHQTNTTAGTTTAVTGMPTLPGSLNGVRGVDITGAAKAVVTNEYEVCFRCHGDSTGQPAAPTVRKIVQTNKRLEFQTTNPSYHPVAGVGKGTGTSVPSLIAPLTTSSTITCSACHNNNAGPQAAPTAGTGPNGPHGSGVASMLAGTYSTTYPTTYSTTAYALCFKCHNPNTVNADSATSFRYHAKHLSANITCNACHDPHGISSTQGTVAGNSKLINFNSEPTDISATNTVRIVMNGNKTGTCYLACHGKTHNGLTY